MHVASYSTRVDRLQRIYHSCELVNWLKMRSEDGNAGGWDGTKNERGERERSVEDGERMR